MNLRTLSFMICLLLTINRELLQPEMSHYFLIKISKFLYYLIENQLLNRILSEYFETLLVNMMLIIYLRDFEDQQETQEGVISLVSYYQESPYNTQNQNFIDKIK